MKHVLLGVFLALYIIICVFIGVSLVALTTAQAASPLQCNDFTSFYNVIQKSNDKYYFSMNYIEDVIESFMQTYKSIFTYTGCENQKLKF